MKRAITVTAYALVPDDEYDMRIGEIIDGLEQGLQQAGADYIGPRIQPGCPAEIIAVGASDSKRGIASREEVRNRQAEREEPLPPCPICGSLEIGKFGCDHRNKDEGCRADTRRQSQLAASALRAGCPQQQRPVVHPSRPSPTGAKPMKRAITVTAYALVPDDEYDMRIGEIIDGLEQGLQQAGADYIGPRIEPGIPAEMSDHL